MLAMDDALVQQKVFAVHIQTATQTTHAQLCTRSEDGTAPSRVPSLSGLAVSAILHGTHSWVQQSIVMLRAISSTVVLLWALYSLPFIFAASTFDLSGMQWTLQNSNRSISASTTLPSYPLEVLKTTGIIKDPLFRYGEAESRWVATETWTWSTTFDSSELSGVMGSKAVQLRLDGLNTFASVQLNGKTVLTADNFHRRWFVPVKQQLVPGTNKLSITIRPATAESVNLRNTFGQHWPFWPAPKSVGAFNMARKPAADFGWDWGPAYAPTGIHGGVQLVGYDNAIIQASSMSQHKVGSNFQLTVVLDMQAPAAESGTVLLSLAALQLSATQPVTFAAAGASQATVRVNVPESAVTRWWPVNYGPQQLYDVQVTYTPTSGSIACRSGDVDNALPSAAGDVEADESQRELNPAACVKAAQSLLTRHIGLRTVELVRRPPAEAVKELLPPGEAGWGESPSSGETYYFKVNGVPIFAKGANLVPLRVVHSAVTKGVIQDTMEYALATNMNMIRIWGGGSYMAEELYDLADQYGIMIWVDSMFACAQYPNSQAFLSNVAAETTQQAQRLSWHPSLVMWAGNNENEQALGWFQESTNNPQYYKDAYKTLFVDTIRPVVRRVIPHVPYVDGSPNKGVWQDDDSGYSKRWGNTNAVDTGDLHFYTYGCQCSDCEDPNIYPKGRFISEFGIQSYPTWETLAPAMGPADSYVDSGQMYWRQRKFSEAPSSVFNFVSQRFRLPDDWNAGDAASRVQLLKSFLYMGHMQQARCYQSALSYWRRLRANPGALTMGALYWQLNDIAPYVSWSGYDSGGRWKPLSYYVRRVFAPVAVHVLEAWGKMELWVLNDYTTAQPLAITVRLLSLTKTYDSSTSAGCSAELVPVKTLTVTAPANFAKWVWSISVDDLLKQKPGCTRSTCFVHVTTSANRAKTEDGANAGAAPDQTAPDVTAYVRIPAPSASDVEEKSSAAAEPDAETDAGYSSPASFWPKEGASPISQKPQVNSTSATPPTSPAAAEAGDRARAPAPGSAEPRQGGTGLSVPDVQLLLAAPRVVDFVDPKVKSSKPSMSGHDGALTFTVESEAAASHLWLSTAHPGHFSDNAVTLHPCLPQTFSFYPHRSIQSQLSPEAFRSSLRAASVFNHQFGTAAGSGSGDGNGGGGWGWWREQQGDDKTDGPAVFGRENPAVGSSRVFADRRAGAKAQGVGTDVQQ